MPIANLGPIWKSSEMNVLIIIILYYVKFECIGSHIKNTSRVKIFQILSRHKIFWNFVEKSCYDKMMCFWSFFEYEENIGYQIAKFLIFLNTWNFLNWNFQMRRRVLLCLVSLTVAVSAQSLVPNHVSLNEKRKHIEVDSSWLDKKQKEVQRVSEMNFSNMKIFKSCTPIFI